MILLQIAHATSRQPRAATVTGGEQGANDAIDRARLAADASAVLSHQASRRLQWVAGWRRLQGVCARRHETPARLCMRMQRVQTML